MVENHTAFVMYRFKAIEDPNNEFLELILQELGCPTALLPIVVTPAGWLLRPKANKRITATIGQFPVEDFKDFLRKDLNTYRDLLGDKKYFFGDEISSADCTVFAHLATLLYIPPNNYAKETILDGYPELFNYCNRIRDTPLPSSRNEAIARTIERTAENHTVLLMRQFKVIEDPNNEFVKMFLQEFGCPAAFLPTLTPFVAYMMKRKVCKRITASIGQLSTEDFKQLLRMDLDTYRDLLGDKFLFGDEVSSADCSVFSALAAILYIPPDNYAKELVQEQYPQLVAYCNRFRDTVFGKDFIEK
ncbi:Glutathione S-transferase domain containing protein [Trichostrongylus colubriformis]|uniref:Glutathione S-transferase domain containing protein n=1 Tax=Trichostrongylus colubriformis TaxID=6319 RepID=A0AAN8ENM0_TRICO